MNHLAYFAHDGGGPGPWGWHGGGGPGPWVLLFPLVWAALVVAVVLVLRRFARRRGPWPMRAAAHGEKSPVVLLGQRYALGEVDETEYRRRLAVLRETAPTGAGSAPDQGPTGEASGDASGQRLDGGSDQAPGGAA